VTFVGALIHIYAIGYMHGDSRFARFFAFLNLFLVFMLILVSGNNLLMMFVGWEGVGLCSYLLIGFWWDKPNGEGWRNSDAARKAFIVNRIGDFGLLLGIFLVFWTFGTLDFYRPGEIANPHFGEHSAHAEDAAHDEAAVVESAHGESAAPTDNTHLNLDEMGIFGQAERLLNEDHQVDFGPFWLDIDVVIALIAFFMLLGATGKSAQIPLFIWLPDAMAGPTPVSALIHAATMVTAGVYMMVRANVFYEAADLVSFLVAVIGAGTALVAGFIAMGQWDIKRVLAYSTISQLGFMVAAVGVGAFSAAMFHLVTHAFFKGLLFLASGSVIHGIEHGAHETHEHVDPQDMRNMGGLSDKMPTTYRVYLAGTLALAGIFPFAGFWSKDEILADSWLAGLFNNDLGGYVAFGVLFIAAGFTAFYMWRQVEMVFHGTPRTQAAAHAHESPRIMTTPLIVLAFFSIFAGFINTPANVLGLDTIFGAHRLTNFLSASVANAHAASFQPLIALGALALGIAAIFLARAIYGGERAVVDGQRDPLELNPNTGTYWSLANAKLYWDEFYFWLLIRPFQRLARFFAETIDWTFWHDYFHDTVLAGGFNAVAHLLSTPIDLGVVDGAVNGVGWLTAWVSRRLRTVQTGYVRTYAIALLLGVVTVLVIMIIPMLQNGG
jgi:NADH-quinone oxidoreductase subunit L